MKNRTFNPLALLGNLLLFFVILYMAKTVMGIDVNPNCHAEEVILGICKFKEFENKIY